MRSGSLVGELFGGGPDAVLVEAGEAWPRSRLAAAAERAAGGLASLGVGRGDRVAVAGPSSVAWVIGLLATLRLGAIALPVNPAYREAELAHLLADGEPAAVLAGSGQRPLLETVAVTLPRPPRLLDLQSPPAGPPPPFPRLGPDDPALILYTSGTTGRPKGALLDHGNLLAQVRGVHLAWRWSAGERLVLALPLFHLHGLAMGLLGTLLAGSRAELAGFDAATVSARLESGATLFLGVPTMYQALCDHLEAAGEGGRMGGVRLFVSGSAPLPPALFERCSRLLGQPPLERYGITEGGIVVSNPLAGPRRPGRVGYPLPGVEVALGEADEILLRGGQVFSGYWRNPEAGAQALFGGWLHTGDVGQLDPDGSLAIRGRLKELIITGGFNVYPREVELALEAHPLVAEVAVAGLPSERWGEEVAAFVVPRPGPAPDPDELVAWCRERLATYKCPRSVRLVPALPRNAMGKVRRDLLA